MTPAMYRRNSWFPTVFDEFLNSDLMNTVSTTAPSVNVKETEKAYIVELAAPGVKKTSSSTKKKTNTRTICAASSRTPTMSRNTVCRMM